MAIATAADLFTVLRQHQLLQPPQFDELTRANAQRSRPMSQWHLVRSRPGRLQGVSVGPMSTATLLELASSGGLPADDWARMEGIDVEITVGQFVEMARSGKVPAIVPSDDLLPDWLSDVAENETVLRPADTAVPDWLLEMLRDEIAACVSLKRGVPPLEAAPDWLEDIQQIEESLRVSAPPKPETAPPTPPPVPPTATPIQRPPVQPTSPPSQPPAVLPPSVPPTPSPTHRPTSVPPDQPPSVQPEHAAKPTIIGHPQRAAKTAIGYNPETGQVLDPVAYARWQKAEAKRRQEELRQQPVASVADRFLDACKTLQAWVDADENKALVMSADMEAIRSCAAIEELLKRNEGYGPVMREKLLKRLAFLVDNRKRFSSASE